MITPDEFSSRILLTEDSIKDSFSLVPFGERCISTLLGRGVDLPITYTSSYLPELTELAAMIYFSGSLSFDQRNTYNAKISLTANPLHDRVIESAKYFNLGYEGKVGKNNEVQLGKGSAGLGRVIYQLGWVASVQGQEIKDTKARKGTKLPDYIQDIIYSFDKFDDSNKEIAREIIKPVVDVWMLSKGFRDNNVYQVHALNMVSESCLLEQISDLIHAIKAVYPQHPMLLSRAERFVPFYNKRDDLFTAQLGIPYDVIRKLNRVEIVETI